MQPFEQAWRLLKSYTSGPPSRDQIDPKAHMMQSADNSGMGFAQIMPRPETFENRQFNVKNIEDEDTSGRVRGTYPVRESANFSTGDEMSRRINHANKIGRENPTPAVLTEDFPALTDDDMAPNLRYPFRSKLEGNPSQFALAGNFPLGSEPE